MVVTPTQPHLKTCLKPKPCRATLWKPAAPRNGTLLPCHRRTRPEDPAAAGLTHATCAPPGANPAYCAAARGQQSFSQGTSSSAHQRALWTLFLTLLSGNWRQLEQLARKLVPGTSCPAKQRLHCPRQGMPQCAPTSLDTCHMARWHHATWQHAGARQQHAATTTVTVTDPMGLRTSGKPGGHKDE